MRAGRRRSARERAEIGLPAPRTSADCETAALALLDDAGHGWSGEYQAWSKFLPVGQRIFFRETAGGECAVADGFLYGDRARSGTGYRGHCRENSRYTLRFVDAGDPSLILLLLRR